ncbi:hypothetical protein [Streptosporangium roseum]|uniref:hypothetical protein n=1 Tax=Streptosporangium roseum TaxID=2001 RepID=UPI003328CDE4
MKPVVQVRLLPTPEQAALEATLCAVNEAATWVSALAHHQRVFRFTDQGVSVRVVRRDSLA